MRRLRRCGAMTIVALACTAFGAASAGAAVQTFASTGGEQTFSVPAGVSAVHVVAIGARGGSQRRALSVGGTGDRVEGDVGVPPGATVLFVEVGARGEDGPRAAFSSAFNGGGEAVSGAPRPRRRRAWRRRRGLRRAHAAAERRRFAELAPDRRGGRRRGGCPRRSRCRPSGRPAAATAGGGGSTGADARVRSRRPGRAARRSRAGPAWTSASGDGRLSAIGAQAARGRPRARVAVGSRRRRC